MTWGVLRPVILLPADAGDWPEERLTTALLHELAHVRRWDFLTQLAARAACAIYWFNPLAWLALARVRREQEQAADDVALGCGLDRYAYAGHLLAIVAGRSSGGSAHGRGAGHGIVREAGAPAARHPRRGPEPSRAGPTDGRPRRGRRGGPSSCPWRPSTPGAKPGRTSCPRCPPSCPRVPPADGAAPKPKADEVGVESEVLAKVREVYIKPPGRVGAPQGRNPRDARRAPRSAFRVHRRPANGRPDPQYPG